MKIPIRGHKSITRVTENGSNIMAMKSKKRPFVNGIVYKFLPS